MSLETTFKFFLIIYALLLLSCNKSDPEEIFPCYGLPVKKEIPVLKYDLPISGKYVKNLMTYKDKIILIAEVFNDDQEEIIVYCRTSKTYNITKNKKNEENQYLLSEKYLFYNQKSQNTASVLKLDLLSNQLIVVHTISNSSEASLFDNLQWMDETIYFTYNDDIKKIISLFMIKNTDKNLILVTQIPSKFHQKVRVNKSLNGQTTFSHIYETYENEIQYEISTYRLSDPKIIYQTKIPDDFSFPTFQLGYNNEIYFYSKNKTISYDLTTGNQLFSEKGLIRPFDLMTSYAESTIYDPLTGKLLFDISPFKINDTKTIIHRFENSIYLLLERRFRKLNMETGCYESEINLTLGERIMFDESSDSFYSVDGNTVKIYTLK
jgi:hypothetical protein